MGPNPIFLMSFKKKKKKTQVEDRTRDIHVHWMMALLQDSENKWPSTSQGDKPHRKLTVCTPLRNCQATGFCCWRLQVCCIACNSVLLSVCFIAKLISRHKLQHSSYKKQGLLKVIAESSLIITRPLKKVLRGILFTLPFCKCSNKGPYRTLVLSQLTH